MGTSKPKPSGKVGWLSVKGMFASISSIFMWSIENHSLKWIYSFEGEFVGPYFMYNLNTLQSFPLFYRVPKKDWTACMHAWCIITITPCRCSNSNSLNYSFYTSDIEGDSNTWFNDLVDKRKKSMNFVLSRDGADDGWEKKTYLILKAYITLGNIWHSIVIFTAFAEDILN